MDITYIARQCRIACDPVPAATEHAVNPALMRVMVRPRIVVPPIVVALLLVLTPATVKAHTQLLATTPENGSIVSAPPESVEFQFNEPVEPVPEGFVLLDPEGTQSDVTVVPQRDRVQVQLPDAMGQGTFVLAMRVISADGHPISGAVTFSIGVESAVNDEALAHQEDQTVERLSSIARGTTYLGLLVAAGLMLFQLVVLPSAPTPPRSIVQVATTAALLAILSGAAGLPLSVARQQGQNLGDLESVDNWFEAIDTHEARAFAALFLSLLVALTLIWFGGDSKGERYLLMGAVIVALISPTLSGHTNTYEPRWVLRVSNSLHTITGAFWIGGLIGLMLLMRALARGTADRSGSNELCHSGSRPIFNVGQSVAGVCGSHWHGQWLDHSGFTRSADIDELRPASDGQDRSRRCSHTDRRLESIPVSPRDSVNGNRGHCSNTSAQPRGGGSDYFARGDHGDRLPGRTESNRNDIGGSPPNKRGNRVVR